MKNATFEVTEPKILQKGLAAIHLDKTEESKSDSNCNLDSPIDTRITNTKDNAHLITNETVKCAAREVLTPLSNDTGDSKNVQNLKEENFSSENTTDQRHKLANETNMNINYNNLITKLEIHQNLEIHKNKRSLTEFQTVHNAKNKKLTEPLNKTEKALYFDEIIVDGVKEKIGTRDGELLPEESSSTNKLVFADLPPLNGKKANMNDLKELMDIGNFYCIVK